jgi:tetratricopeptide (TPR) repeat protein
MTRPADTPITRAVGMEVCERVGGAALIVGSIAALGERYAVGLEAIACATGESLARQQVEVKRKEDVLGAVGRVAAALRSRLGESLGSVDRFNVPTTQATTASLEALRAVRLGDAARGRGQTAEALAYYRQAVALDPDFALGLVRVATMAISAHYEGEGTSALERAYSLRDRATLPERLEIEQAYHTFITGDLNGVTVAIETLRRTYPNSAAARRGLSNQYKNVGRYDEALAEALEAQRLDPGGSATHSVLAWAYLCLNRLADARATVESAVALGVDSESLHTVLLQIGFHLGDTDLIERERAWAARRPEATPWFLESEAEEAVWRGRLRDAVRYLERYDAWARERGAEQRGVVIRLRMARFEALCGKTAEALARVDRELAGGVSPHLKIEALKVVVSAGDLARTARLIDELDRAAWPGVAQPDAGFMAAYRAALETGRRRPDRALEILRPSQPFELGFSWGFIPLYERARAHLAADDWRAAQAAFEKMLTHPTVSSGQKLLPMAQLGVARALAAGGQAAESRKAFESFFTLWRGADADLPLLAQARQEHARLR